MREFLRGVILEKIGEMPLAAYDVSEAAAVPLVGEKECQGVTGPARNLAPLVDDEF